MKKFNKEKIDSRKERRENKRWARAYKYNEHHILVPKSLGGCKEPYNLITLDISHHEAWHFLFGNSTLDEVIELLERIKGCQHNRKGKTSHKRNH